MLYKVDSSSGDVVIYWTMTSTHVVPDRKQYDEHTHQADMIPGVSTKYFVSNSSLNKYSIFSTPSVFILERYKLCDHTIATQVLF